MLSTRSGRSGSVEGQTVSFATMSGGELTDLAAARARVQEEIHREQRRLLDRADTAGIGAIAVLTPALLWDFVDRTLLFGWGATLLVLTLTCGPLAVPESQVGTTARVRRTIWIWGSSLLWAALPWLDIGAVEQGAVAWILVFVAVYGITSDVVFLPQTDPNGLYRLLSGYTTSFIVVLAIAQQWGAVVSVVGFLWLLAIGGLGWSQLTHNLTDKRIETELRLLVDELTGVGTRIAAILAIDDLRASDAADIHCVFLDIDDFKHLNDTYGYAAGDAALCGVADLMRAALPDDWQVARFGGDEFVAIGASMPDLRALDEVEVSLSAHGEGPRLRLALSVGVTRISRDAADPDVLFREAGEALRIAKTTGKHRTVEMTTERREHYATRLDLGRAVGRAIEREEIIAFGHLIVDLHDGAPAGVELLARWPRADGTVTMPGEFVPVVEEQGRGAQLGDLMMRHAVTFGRRLVTAGLPHFLTVNLSARHLFHRDLAAEIATLLRDAELPAAQLVLEITESQHLPQSSAWKATATELRALGVGLAIDDFGTGYSSMEQLLSMPFSHLKADRIITTAHERPGAGDLASAVAAMATGAGMVAIAEGIETDDQRRQMIDAGYCYGQGFLFGKPQPLDELFDEFTSTASDTTSPVQQ